MPEFDAVASWEKVRAAIFFLLEREAPMSSGERMTSLLLTADCWFSVGEVAKSDACLADAIGWASVS